MVAATNRNAASLRAHRFAQLLGLAASGVQLGLKLPGVRLRALQLLRQPRPRLRVCHRRHGMQSWAACGTAREKWRTLVVCFVKHGPPTETTCARCAWIDS